MLKTEATFSDAKQELVSHTLCQIIAECTWLYIPKPLPSHCTIMYYAPM